MRYDAGEVITAMVTPFNEKREVDYNKVSNIIIKDLRDGYLGKVTFDERV